MEKAMIEDGQPHGQLPPNKEKAPLLGHSTERLISERHKTHGDWKDNARCIRDIKEVVHRWDGGHLTPEQREALEAIAGKMGRILTGAADFPDHWDDIAGYALLGKKGHG